MKIEKTDIIHSLYNATTVGWDEVNNKWLASDASGNPINVVEADVDAEYAKQEYVEKRETSYPTIEEQMDMQYRDAINGTTEWKDHVANVKASTTKPSDIAEFTEDPKKVQLVGRKSWDAWVDNWSPP